MNKKQKGKFFHIAMPGLSFFPYCIFYKTRLSQFFSESLYWHIFFTRDRMMAVKERPVNKFLPVAVNKQVRLKPPPPWTHVEHRPVQPMLYYPPVIMPEQPEQYIKCPKHDFL
jgi:hypothetical protein